MKGSNMSNFLAEKMKKNPIIAGVKDIEKFDDAVNSDCDIIFLLCGSIFNIKGFVKKAKEKNKVIFIHVDLLDGFSKDAVALKYIYDEIKPDGIISTKNSQLKAAKSLGFMTVQRIFIIDSLSINTAIKASQMINPDAIEILPGIMPKITKKMSDELDVPVIVGGLISDKDEIENALRSGALGVSTSAKELWR